MEIRRKNPNTVEMAGEIIGRFTRRPGKVLFCRRH